MVSGASTQLRDKAPLAVAAGAEISRGTLTASLVHPREIYRRRRDLQHAWEQRSSLRGCPAPRAPAPLTLAWNARLYIGMPDCI
jgi:hypothetical protein